MSTDQLHNDLYPLPNKRPSDFGVVSSAVSSAVSSVVLSAITCLTLLSACVESQPAAELNANTEECVQGKCDRVSDEVYELYSDMKRVNLDDLVSLGAGLATHELNSLLAELPYIDIKLGETALFGVEPRELFGETMIEDIYSLQAGLTAGLGEDAFATKINMLRLSTLESSSSEVFAETSFKLGGALSKSWSLDHGDTLGEIGFQLSPRLEAIVIAPYENPSEAVLNQPLRVLSESRGFVLPRDVNDIRKMTPGSSVTLRGEGVVGLNLGVGVPLVATAIAQYLTLSARLSGAARLSLSGDLDVQLVRGAGDVAYLDVGLTEQRVKHLSVAISSGYGVEGLPELEISVGGLRVNLAEVLQDAFERQLNEKLGAFDAQRSSTSVSGRLSVARFEFDLSRATPSVIQALQQGMRGDIRLAQSLAIRDESGVTRHLELTKEFQLDSKYLGFRLLSMRFFKSSAEAHGQVHIGSNGERQEILFSEIERKGGFFFTERGSNWRQVTSTIQGPNGQRSLNNARLIITEHDSFLSKDQINDHLDSLLVYFYGDEGVFNHIGFAADLLSEYADKSCGSRPDHDARRSLRTAYERCVTELPSDPKLQSLVSDVYASSIAYEGRWRTTDFAQRLTSALDVGQRVLAARVGVSSAHDAPNVGLSGPEGTLMTQVRFSAQAVKRLMAPEAHLRFVENLETVMALMDLDRGDDLDDRVDERADYLDAKQRRITDLAETYISVTKRYQQLDEVAKLQWRDGSNISDEAMLLLVPEDQRQSPSIKSLAQLKGEIIGQLYDELLETARFLGEPDTLLVGYSLLMMAPPSELEVMFSGRFEEDHASRYADHNFNIYSRGDADFIEAGVFDLEEILSAKSL